MSPGEKILAVILAIIAGLAIWGMIAEQKRWNEFKVTHACKVTGHIAPSSAVGISSSGNVVPVFIDGKTCWLCNDGVTYCR